MKRGDIVLVDFPFTDQRKSKIRPALVVQNDSENTRRRKTIIALITGNLRLASEPTQLRVDPSTSQGASSHLHGPSLVSCNDLFTIDQASVIQTIGSLSRNLMAQIDDCLKAALGVS